MTPTPPARRPPRSRYRLAALVAIAGIAVAFGCALAAQAALSSTADGFARTSVPGELTVLVERAATYYVYAEGTLWLHPSVRVTDPDGHAVPVKTTSPGPNYGGSAVGAFDATRTGGTTGSRWPRVPLFRATSPLAAASRCGCSCPTWVF